MSTSPVPPWKELDPDPLTVEEPVYQDDPDWMFKTQHEYLVLRDRETHDDRSRFGAILIGVAIVVLAGIALWLAAGGWR